MAERSELRRECLCEPGGGRLDAAAAVRVKQCNDIRSGDHHHRMLILLSLAISLQIQPRRRDQDSELAMSPR